MIFSMITPTQPATTTGRGPSPAASARSSVNRCTEGPESAKTTTSCACASATRSSSGTTSTVSTPVAEICAGDSVAMLRGATTRTWKPRSRSCVQSAAAHLSWESNAATTSAVGESVVSCT